MRLVAASNLQAFWKTHPDAEASLRVWMSLMCTARFANMGEVQSRFVKAKILNGERARFEIAGGNYRLIAAIYFPSQTVYIKFIGAHADYDRIDAFTIAQF